MDGASKQINPISTLTNNNTTTVGNNDVGGSMMMMKERPKSTDTTSLSRPSTTTTVSTVSTATQSSRPETHNLKTTVPMTVGEEGEGVLENTKTLEKTETILPPLDINLNGPSYMKMTEERKAQTITNQSSISYTPTKQLIPVYIIIILLYSYKLPLFYHFLLFHKQELVHFVV